MCFIVMGNWNYPVKADARDINVEKTIDINGIHRIHILSLTYTHMYIPFKHIQSLMFYIFRILTTYIHLPSQHFAIIAFVR